MLNVRLVFSTGTLVELTLPVSYNFTSRWFYPSLNCSSVWDPHLLTDIKSLESVQSFATKIITKSWQSSAESRISSLNLQTLFNRQKVQLCFRILSDRSIIPSSFFTPHPYPNLRHTNSRPLYYDPSVKSKSHLSSFKLSCVPIWNCLPPHCVLATSSCSFKKLFLIIPL